MPCLAVAFATKAALLPLGFWLPATYPLPAAPVSGDGETVGFIAILLGLVVNNAILLGHQARTAERQGVSRHHAVEEALVFGHVGGAQFGKGLLRRGVEVRLAALPRISGDVPVVAIGCLYQVPGAVTGVSRQDHSLRNFEGFIVFTLQLIGPVGHPGVLL